MLDIVSNFSIYRNTDILNFDTTISYLTRLGLHPFWHPRTFFFVSILERKLSAYGIEGASRIGLIFRLSMSFDVPKHYGLLTVTKGPELAARLLTGGARRL